MSVTIASVISPEGWITAGDSILLDIDGENHDAVVMQTEWYRRAGLLRIVVMYLTPTIVRYMTVVRVFPAGFEPPADPQPPQVPGW